MPVQLHYIHKEIQTVPVQLHYIHKEIQTVPVQLHYIHKEIQTVLHFPTLPIPCLVQNDIHSANN